MLIGRGLRLILGYVVGGSIFLILLPYALVRASAHLDHLVPVALVPFPALRFAVAGILLVVGLWFGIWSNVEQYVKGRGGPVEFAGVEISPKTQHLVVTGPYRCTRNPMLFGACMLYYGVALLLNSITAFALVTLFMLLMLLFVRLSEEPRLRRDFGGEYEEYRRKVSMFFPWTKT